MRIATIILNLPKRSRIRTVHSPEEIALALEDKFALSNHQLSLVGRRYTCSGCQSSFLSSDPSFQHRLATRCNPLPSCSKPSLMSNHMMHVGNRAIHHSHSLAIHRGLVYCRKCGSRKGSDLIKRLANACCPPSAYGRSSLAAIRDDRLPPGLDEWPDLCVPCTPSGQL